MKTYWVLILVAINTLLLIFKISVFNTIVNAMNMGVWLYIPTFTCIGKTRYYPMSLLNYPLMSIGITVLYF